ncbi:MAG: hypothetical protein JXB26_03225 [Candidatus Aminicenantes bacterium]|nr:hypothetical protein [Candidatus Aminicenantes bacterium]
MSKCSICSNRKAKRVCPALGKSICSLCCGRVREKEINCPSDCVHLQKNKSYQNKRILEKKAQSAAGMPIPEKDILRDKKMAWLALHIESLLGERAARDTKFTDKDALNALEYSRDRIDRESALIITSTSDFGPKNQLGEQIFHNIQQCRYDEKRIIVPGENNTYSKEEKIKVLDRIIREIKSWTRDNAQKRIFLDRLLDRFEKIMQRSRQ